MLTRNFLPSPFMFISAIVFFSAFYFHPNMGGEGLFLPFNSLVWIATTLVIPLAIWSMLKQQVIRLPNSFGLILSMPLLILLTGFIVGMEQPLSWMLRISAIVLGFLFFFSLFQFNASRREIHNALYILCGALLLHAVVGVVQLSPVIVFSTIIPNSSEQIALGFFQQPNLQASLMATAVGLSVYLLSTPDFFTRPVSFKLLLLLCLLLSVFVLTSSGSRVGLLGGSISLLLMLSCRVSLLKRRKVWALNMFVVVLVGGTAGLVLNDGSLRAYSKMEQLGEQGHDVRKDVYRISWEAIKEKPLLGHGIGSFQRVFHDKAAEYQATMDDFSLGVSFSHPHNELLLWGVESGAVGLLAFFFAISAVVLQLIRLGWQRGGAMAALLLPIALHTQVEHPFYVSAYHWIIFLFLLFVLFQFGRKTYPLRMSVAAGWLSRGVSVLLLVIVIWFCGTSLYFSYRIVYVLYSGEAKLDELNTIRRHPYFSDVATRNLLGNLSEEEKSTKRKLLTLEYVQWMETYLKNSPDVGVFLNLIRAYAYLGDTVRMQATIDRALYLYREQPLILKTAKEVSGDLH